MSQLDNAKNSEVLMTLRDKDIFPDATDISGVVWKDRPTGKIVLFDENNHVALLGNKVNDFFLLPGGGIESDESVLDGTKRECREETGCEIEITETLGMTEDFRTRDSKHCISFGYSAKIISCGQPIFTENEADIGAYVKWLSLPEAIELFANQEKKVKAGKVKFYNTCFNILRDSLFLRLAQTNHKNS